MKIGEQIQYQRKLNGMSQGELANELHISRQSISKWENGTTLPSFSNIVIISDLFNISLDELIKNDDEVMANLELKDPRVSKTWKIILISFIVAAVVMSSLRLFHMSDDGIHNMFMIPELIAFAFLIININWKRFNKGINKKIIFWGVIWLALYLIPIMNDFVSGFIAGFTGS